MLHARDVLCLETLTGALLVRGHLVQAASIDVLTVPSLVARHRPHVCVLDAGDGSAWLDVARRLRREVPLAKVLLLGPVSSPSIRVAYDTGLVDAVVDRGCAFGQLDAALLATARGGRPLASARRRPPDADPDLELTKRERQVLERLMGGATTFAIAQDLGISPHTVRSHVQGLLRKLDVHARGRAVSVALSQNLLRQRGA